MKWKFIILKKSRSHILIFHSKISHFTCKFTYLTHPLRSTLIDVNVVIPALLGILLWPVFFYLFTSSYLKHVTYRHTFLDFEKSILSVFLLIIMFSPFTFNIIIDKVGFRSTILLFAFVCPISFLFLCSFFLSWMSIFRIPF